MAAIQRRLDLKAALENLPPEELGVHVYKNTEAFVTGRNLWEATEGKREDEERKIFLDADLAAQPSKAFQRLMVAINKAPVYREGS